MSRFSIIVFAALFSMFFGGDASARTVKGKVVCGKEKLSNVIVTDGYNFTKTKRNGEFKMELADSARNALSVFIDAIAVLLITTCVIPILVILFFLWMIKLIFGLNIDLSEARRWIPSRRIR